MESLMMNPDVGLEVVAIVAGIFLSGHLLSISLIAIPALVRTSTTASSLLKQWKLVCDLGHDQGPVLAVTATLLYSYAAWVQSTNEANWRSYATAAALTIGIVPYTWIFMDNQKLFKAVDEIEKDKEAVGKEYAEKMIKSWANFHIIRALLPLAGALTGLLATLRIAQF